MLFVVIASAVLVTVLGAEDPTKVCLPEKFQTLIFTFKNDVTGVAAFDFPNKVVSIRSTNGYRTVFNLTDNSAVAINETSGLCVQLASDPRFSTIGTRCLPANAVNPGGNLTTYVGFGSTKTEFEGWQFDVPGVGSITAAVTKTTPAYPILRQYLSKDGKEKEIVFFFNAQDSIEDEKIFDIPDTCVPPTVVG